jgi:cellulose synthase/poly-beta-1,6-N-acetylglucosamine synthase-like glycosyltransferase
VLIHALLFCCLGLLLASTLLFLFGRRLPGPAPWSSLLLIGGLAALSGWAVSRVGTPPAETALLVAGCFVLGVALTARFPHWNAVGHAAWLFTLAATGMYLLVAAVFALLLPVSLVGAAVGILLLALQGVSAFFTLSFTHETIDVICRRRWRRPEARPPRLAERAQLAERPEEESWQRPWPPDAGPPPRVALHVPCHEEPIAVVAGTLRSLARLAYPRGAYQVFVVDNNTSDPALWRPIAKLCAELGFVFLHLEDWPGYKSGALNYALAATPPEYDLIGIVDADYVVAPPYLRDLVGHLAEPAVAFVQTPQDYRDYRPDSTLYQRACYHAYRYFFDLSMPSRNERNAIIFGGTMGLLRRSALEEVGGWDEWCITEDAEVSLRLLARGYAGRFVNRSYGRGLMPLEFDALKRQRFRWCFGGVQILRKHWAALLPWARRDARRWEQPGPTVAQRYHYLAGGLQWFGDVLAFAFTALLLVSGWLLVLGHPVQLPIAGTALLLLPLVFWGTSLLRTLWALRATRACTWWEAAGAATILWSLGWVVTLACVQGLVRRRGVFLRTPKAGRASVARALRSTAMETALGLGCWVLGAVTLSAWFSSHAASGLSAGGLGEIAHASWAWWRIETSGVLLGVFAFLQGGTYLSAFLLCLLSLRTEGAAREARKRAMQADVGEGTREWRLVAGALAVLGALSLALLAPNVLPGGPPSASQSRQQALNQLLGGANPLATATATAGAGGGGTPTVPPGGTTPPPATSATGTPGGAAPTATPRPGATRTPQPGPTKTPPRPTPRPTPSAHP